jgi:hypothetical protein
MSHVLQKVLAWIMGEQASARTAPLADWIGDGPIPERLEPAPVAKPPSAQSRRLRIVKAFDSSMPVENRHGLSGRNEELARLLNAVVEQGKHALVFGGRGSGKTSLSRVFGELADEARFLVLYHSVSGDLGFRDLMAPFVTELVNTALAHGRRPAPFPDHGDNARLLADWMAANFDQDIVLLLDEFDRIKDGATKEELASLMKLLSDMRLPIRLFIIGIAGDVEDLVVGHPSLRRHLEAIQLASISRSDLDHLLRHCCTSAGVTIAADAREALTRAAMGSAYHLRLFGMHAALQADDRGASHITGAEVTAGLASALQEWAMVSRETHDGFRRLLAMPSADIGCLSVVAVLASYVGQLDAASLIDALRAAGFSGDTVPDRVERLLDALEPVMEVAGSGKTRTFRDNLSAQFLMLMIVHADRIAEASQDRGRQRSEMDLAFHEVGEAFR